MVKTMPYQTSEEHNQNINLLNLIFVPINLTEIITKIGKAIENKDRVTVGYVNIHALNLAWDMPAFRSALNNLDIIFCDGFGVVLGAWLTGQRLPERHTPPDFIHHLMKIVDEKNGSVFLLGASPGVAERASQNLIRYTPGLKVSGVHSGYFDKQPESPENIALLAQINTARPAVLLVGFGMPLQEQWLVQNWAKLDVNVAFTVGALFDTLAGNIPRAPRLLTNHGLEWLGRLIIEPRRLWRRYLIGNPLFFWRLIRSHWFG